MYTSTGYSFFHGFLSDLRGHGIVYLVCIAVIVGSFKFLERHPQSKKFALLGAFLILGAGLGGGIMVSLIGQVMVGSLSATSLSNWEASINTWNLVSGILYFLIGVANAAGIACLAWAVFVDRVKMSAKKVSKKRPARRRTRDEDDEDEDEEDDRPRRRRSRRDDDDDDE